MQSQRRIWYKHWVSGRRTYFLDAELAAVVAQLTTLDLSDIPAARVEERRLRELRPAPDGAGVAVSDAIAPGMAGEPDVAVRVYRPTGVPASGIGVLDIHGGGFVLGGLATSAAACLELSRQLGAVVVSVDYRLSPEHTYPSALRDCRAALEWFAGSAAGLGVDPERIAVHGISAGAGLGAGLALHVRDHGGPRIAFLYLAIPELDDRQATPSMVSFTDTPVWTRTKAGISWDAYLGPGRAGAADVEPYAAPARATDLSGLPATYLSVAMLDPLRDEAIAFAQTLLAAGVPVELHLFPGTFHGSSLIDAAVSRRELRERLDVLRHALAPPSPGRTTDDHS
jgi:acetyl esterase